MAGWPVLHVGAVTLTVDPDKITCQVKPGSSHADVCLFGGGSVLRVLATALSG